MTTESNTSTPAAGTPAPGAAAGASPAAGAPAGGEGQASAPQGSAGSTYRPEGLPDHFAGASERETIDKMFGAIKGFQTQVSKYEPPPKDVSGYNFEWSDTVKDYAAGLADDKMFQGVKEDALAAGLNAKTANTFLNKVFERFVAMDVLEKPVNVEAEKVRLAPPEARNLPAPERDAAIQKRVDTNVAFANSLASKGFDQAAAEALAAELPAFPELNQLFEFMRNAGGMQVALGGNEPQAVTQAVLDQRVADPRNDVNSDKYSPRFAAETTEMFKKLYRG